MNVEILKNITITTKIFLKHPLFFYFTSDHDISRKKGAFLYKSEVKIQVIEI